MSYAILLINYMTTHSLTLGQAMEKLTSDSDTKITKRMCQTCNQNVVIMENGQLARHRFPPPTINGQYITVEGMMILGQWCNGR